MSKFQQAKTQTFIAASDLSEKKYHGVKLTSTAGEVDLAGAGEAQFVLMNAPRAGEEAECAMLGGGAQCHSGAAVAIGEEVASDADGKFVPAGSGDIVVGLALAAAVGANEYFEIARVYAVKA